MSMAPNADVSTIANLEHVADIVSAYVSNNSVPAGDLPGLIASIHSALTHLGNSTHAAPAEAPKEPAVSIKKSLTPDYLICLEDGRKFKSLKRHLASAYQMSPEAYREKWGLPKDYPMVAPNYAAQRSQLAKNIGLGQSRAAAAAKMTPAATVSAPAKGRGRPKKAA